MYLILYVRDYYVCFFFSGCLQTIKKNLFFFLINCPLKHLEIMNLWTQATIYYNFQTTRPLNTDVWLFDVFLDEAVFVDHGIPYNDGPLEVGELVITKSIDKSPKHVKGNTCLCAMFTV